VLRLLETRRVDGLFGDTSFLPVGRLEAWGVDGLFSDTDVLSVCRLESRRINGGSVDTNLFAVARLETGSVFTFSYVKLGIVVTAAMDVNIDLSIAERVSKMW
jgi:hypothetical protein